MIKIKGKLHTNKIIRVWFFTYIIVLILPLLINFFLFRRASNLIENEVNSTRSAVLNQLQSNIDDKLFALRRTAVMLANDPKVSGIIKASKNNSLDDKRYEIIELIKYIEILNTSNTNVDNILLYLDKSSRMFNDASFMSDDYAYQYYANKIVYPSYDIWLNDLDRHYRSEYLTQFLTRVDGYQEDTISFAVSLPFGTQNIENNNLFISVNIDKIISNLKDYELSDDAVIYILDENNQIIAATSEVREIKDFSYENLNIDDSVNYGMYNNKEMVALSIKSKINDWKYVVLTDTNNFSEKKMNYTKLVILATIFNIFIGIILAFEFSKRNYKPVKKIINMVSEKYDKTEQLEGEGYNYLQKGFEKAFFKLDTLEDKLKDQHNQLRRNFVNRLLNGDLYDLKVIEDSLHRYDIHMDYDLYTVMIVQVSTVKRDGKKHDLVPLVKIGEYFQEICRSHSNMFYIVQDSQIVIITNTTEEGLLKINNQLYEWVDQLKFELSKVINLQLNVSVSNCHKSILDLSEAYQESLSCLEYIQKYEMDTVMFYEEIQNNQAYYYPLSEEQMLINYIKNGDEESAKNLLVSLYYRNFDVNDISSNLGKSLMFDISASILKSMGKLNQKNIIDQDKELIKIISSKNVTDMQKNLFGLLNKVCQLYYLLLEKEQTILLSSKIDSFIEEHYMDIELNVSRLAEYFQLTPSYLTKLYKSETNQSILSKINKVRIKHAKELLIKTNLSMNEIANRVGILHATSFNRIFKSVECTTPGQFRKVNTKIANDIQN